MKLFEKTARRLAPEAFKELEDKLINKRVNIEALQKANKDLKDINALQRGAMKTIRAELDQLVAIELPRLRALIVQSKNEVEVLRSENASLQDIINSANVGNDGKLPETLPTRLTE